MRCSSGSRSSTWCFSAPRICGGQQAVERQPERPVHGEELGVQAVLGGRIEVGQPADTRPGHQAEQAHRVGGGAVPGRIVHPARQRQAEDHHVERRVGRVGAPCAPRPGRTPAAAAAGWAKRHSSRSTASPSTVMPIDLWVSTARRTQAVGQRFGRRGRRPRWRRSAPRSPSAATIAVRVYSRRRHAPVPVQPSCAPMSAAACQRQAAATIQRLLIWRSDTTSCACAKVGRRTGPRVTDGIVDDPTPSLRRRSGARVTAAVAAADAAAQHRSSTAASWRFGWRCCARAVVADELVAWSAGLIYVAYDTALLGFVAWQTLALLRPPSPPSAPGLRPSVAVIVAAHNEAPCCRSRSRPCCGRATRPTTSWSPTTDPIDATADGYAATWALATPRPGGLSCGDPGGPRVSWLRLPHGGKAAALNAALAADRRRRGADRRRRHAARARSDRGHARRPSPPTRVSWRPPACWRRSADRRSSGRMFEWFQTYEYIRNFLSRYAWTRMDSLLLISGAFAGFRRQAGDRRRRFRRRLPGRGLRADPSPAPPFRPQPASAGPPT